MFLNEQIRKTYYQVKEHFPLPFHKIGEEGPHADNAVNKQSRYVLYTAMIKSILVTYFFAIFILL